MALLPTVVTNHILLRSSLIGTLCVAFAVLRTTFAFAIAVLSFSLVFAFAVLSFSFVLAFAVLSFSLVFPFDAQSMTLIDIHGCSTARSDSQISSDLGRGPPSGGHLVRNHHCTHLLIGSSRGHA